MKASDRVMSQFLEVMSRADVPDNVPVNAGTNDEDPELYCEDCNERIESVVVLATGKYEAFELARQFIAGNRQASDVVLPGCLNYRRLVMP